MKVVVSSNGADLEAPASVTFGRCPMYLFVDMESMQFEAVANPASDASGGAGVQAAQFVISADIQAIITGKVGPKAMNVLHTARIPVYLFGEGTVRQAVEDFKAGKLPLASESNAPEGHGKAQGGGNRLGARPTAKPSPGTRDEEIEALKNEMMDLRQRLTQVLERINQLQEGN